MDYKEVRALNQSTIKYILSNNLKKAESSLFYTESESLLIGNMIDALITSPDSLNYYKCSEKPSDTIMSIIQLAFPDRDSDDINKNQGVIFNSLLHHGYYENLKEDVRIGKVISAGTNYWNALVKANGRVMVSEEQDQLARNLVMKLKTHPYTADIFRDDWEYQKELYWTFKDVPCKGKLDMYMPGIIYDIKYVEGNVFNFYRSLRKYRYDVQNAFYALGAKIVTGAEHQFGFIVVSEGSPFPLVFNLTSEVIEAAMEDINKAADMYTWYELNGWDVPMEVFLKSGKLDITLTDVRD